MKLRRTFKKLARTKSTNNSIKTKKKMMSTKSDKRPQQSSPNGSSNIILLFTINVYDACIAEPNGQSNGRQISTYP